MEFITNFLLITQITFSIFQRYGIILICTTGSGISYQLRDVYSICRCCWNVATYQWKVHNGKIEIISFVENFEQQAIKNICLTIEGGYVPLVVSTSRSFPHSWLITGFAIRLTRRVSLVEQELLTIPEYLSSAPRLFF
jgi:hypothetical protein